MIDVLDKVQPVEITPATEPSFFLRPKDYLDPRLFIGLDIKPEVREQILSLVNQFFDARFDGRQRWCTVWIAGSAASYQWRGTSDLDLDILIGIKMDQFRQDNPAFRSATPNEVADVLNGLLRTLVAPHTASWSGGFEVTFYVNPYGEDIRNLKPYAAYDLTNDAWTVPPSKLRPDWNEERAFPSTWRSAVKRDASQANMIVARFNTAVRSLKTTTNTAQRANLARMAEDAAREGAMMFETIHSSRSQSFSQSGDGYHSFDNYRWQGGKRSGAVGALKALHSVHEAVRIHRYFPTGETALSAKDALTLASLHGTPYVDQERYRAEVLLE